MTVITTANYHWCSIIHNGFCCFWSNKCRIGEHERLLS